MRTDAQIVSQTNDLARTFYARHGNQKTFALSCSKKDGCRRNGIIGRLR